LVGRLPEGARAHVGTTDVDLVIGLALGDETPETYRTLQNKLEKAGFKQGEPSFRWAREVRQGQSNVTCGGMPSIAAEVNPYHAEMIGPASGTRMSIDDSPIGLGIRSDRPDRRPLRQNRHLR